MGKDIQEKKITLTISLLASDRKKTIRKCLDSLKPIMEQVSSELIIVDTGCSVETQEILREYTENIVPFTWCNDFSKARNAGLSKAKGEWFLYIDDDEWFMDASQIIAFFKTGDYKNYAAAMYTVRNYLRYDKTSYSDAWVSRMIKIEDDTRFVSSIHEYLYSQKTGAVKLLYSIAEHFGYIFNTEEEKFKHSKRNISLLLDMMEKEPDNLRWQIQLAQEYRGIREYRKLYELCQSSLEVIKDKDTAYTNKERGCFYSGRLIVDTETFDTEQLEKDFMEAVADPRNNDYCKANIYRYGSEIYFKKENFEECEKWCKRYLKLYRKINDDEVAKLEQGTFFVRDAFEDKILNNIYSFLIECGMRNEDDSNLKKYFDKINWQNKILYVYGDLVKNIVKFLSKREYEPWHLHVIQTFLDRKGPMEEAIEYVKKSEGDEDTDFENLMHLFAKTKSGHYYISYLKVLDAKQTGDKEKMLESFSELFECVFDIFQLDDKIWEVAMENNLDLDPLFTKLSFDRCKKGIDSFCENTTLERLNKRREMIEGWERSDNIRYDYLFLKFEEAALVYGADRDDYDALFIRLRDYVLHTLEFYENFYKTSAFEGEMEILPPNIRVVVKLSDFFLSGDDFRTALSTLKEAVGIYPSMDKTIKSFAKLYGDRQKQIYEEMKTKKQPSETDILEMVDELGEKAKRLIDEGYIEEAKCILESISSFKKKRKKKS